MPAEDAVRSLRERMPWAVAQKVLQRAGIHRSRGWDQTLEAIEAGNIEVNEREGELLEGLEEHLICGEKLVQFFSLEDGPIESLRQRIASLEVGENIFSQSYPALIDASATGAGQYRVPLATAIRTFDDGVAVAFSSIRFLTSRENLGIDELPDEAADALSGFSELIGVRHRKLQAVDILWVPNEGNVIELRADFPWGTLQRQGEIALEQLATVCTAFVGADYFTHQVNLFPTIRALYESVGDGSMVELGFMVSGSAQKLEKSRRGGQCCRTEAYHVGGKNALAAPIQPYRVSVLWQNANVDGNAKAEVSLFGTSLMTADAGAFLGCMTVRNCADMAEYSHVRNRVISYIPA